MTEWVLVIFIFSNGLTNYISPPSNPPVASKDAPGVAVSSLYIPGFKTEADCLAGKVVIAPESSPSVPPPMFPARGFCIRR
jgi:hypothetical protein